VKLLDSFPSHFTTNKEKDLHTHSFSRLCGPHSHSGHFGEQKHLAADDHLELGWRTGKSSCFWSCGAHMKNRKILLLLAM